MLTIYSTPESLYCAKLRILLHHKAAQWQEIEPDGGCGSEQYRALVPSGTMPAMVDGDLLLADSEAIAEYLNETIPAPAMLPTDAGLRARCRERSRFHDTRLEPEVRALFPHIGPDQQGSVIAKTQSEKLSERLFEFSRLLEADSGRDPQLLSLGDCGFPVSFAWIDAFTPVMGLTIDWSDSVLAYRDQLGDHRAVASVLDEYAGPVAQWIRQKMNN